MNDDKEPPLSQREKFEKAARELGADEDENRWTERLRKIIHRKPAPKGK